MNRTKTPATEAGRAILSDTFVATDLLTRILAIEAEARADSLRLGDAASDYEAGWKRGRADALRKAAERVRALAEAGDHIVYDHDEVVSLPAVLAILEEGS